MNKKLREGKGKVKTAKPKKPKVTGKKKMPF